MFGYGDFLICKELHTFRSANEGNDEHMRFLAFRFNKMGLVGFDKEHFPLMKRCFFAVDADNYVAFICVIDFPKIVLFLGETVIFFQGLIMNGHDFLYIQQIFILN